MNIDLDNELNRYFGFKSFNKGQREVILKILEGRSAAAIFPTGSGKSLCYQLPAVVLPNLTIVVSPLISLMHDQQEFLKNKKIPSAVLDSTLSREEYNDTLNRAVNGDLKILMISVERFKNERFRTYLNHMNISLLVVDEAHCISEWGHNFRPEYLKIPNYIQEFNIPQVLLLTATATKNVISDMADKLHVEKEDVIKTGFYRKNLNIAVTPVESNNKLELLRSRVGSNSNDPTIVYVTLQKTAELVSDYLVSNGVSAKPYHAGLKNDVRDNIQKSFMAGEINIIVATIAFGMGIDKSDIRKIIHYDLPKSIENYSQEIGRAGRDGKKSFCEVFWNLDGVNVLENFIYGDTPTREGIKKLLTILSENSNSWEIKLLALSKEVDIKQLPLKTLLVHLEIMGIVSSSHTYFADYQFKTGFTGKELVSQLEGDIRDFTANLLRFTKKKKTWIDVDINNFVESTRLKRIDAVTALENLNNKDLIELSSKQAIEVYKIQEANIDIDSLTNELFNLFIKKEESEIFRISEMLSFFSSKQCLSRSLSNYFGDEIGNNCNHCSVCDGNVVPFEELEYKEMDDISVENLLKDLFMHDDGLPVQTITRFLCGITTPYLISIKAKKIKGWGALEKWPYKTVEKIILGIKNEVCL